MDSVIIARAIHVAAIVHWIGGVAMVTLVLLPTIRRRAPANQQLALFEAIEGKFATQAKISNTLAALSGFYMFQQMDLWSQLSSFDSWWLHLMIFLWSVFAFVLFIAEPLFLHDWFHKVAAAAPEKVMPIVQKFHYILLFISVLAVLAGVMGAHGGI